MFARFIGKRGVGQISPFEFIVIIIVSSAAGDPTFYAHVPLLHGVLVLSVVMLLHRLVSILTDRSERAEDVVEGEPVLIVDDGAIIEDAVGPGTLSRRELLMQLRPWGNRDVGEVERAFFEPNGQLSVVQAPQYMRKETDQPCPRTTGAGRPEAGRDVRADERKFGRHRPPSGPAPLPGVFRQRPVSQGKRSAAPRLCGFMRFGALRRASTAKVTGGVREHGSAFSHTSHMCMPRPPLIAEVRVAS